MPSAGFIRRFNEFLNHPVRRKWVGLDVGCGGHIGVLAEYGLDAAPLKQRNFVDKNYPFEKFTQGNVYNMPFEDNSFDYVVSTNLIEHLENPVDGIREMARVARYAVIVQGPRYTLDLDRVTACVKIDLYYLKGHPELWAKYGVEERLKGQYIPVRTFHGFVSPHCQWFHDPEDCAVLFDETEMFINVEHEVCPSCGEFIVYGWLHDNKWLEK